VSTWTVQRYMDTLGSFCSFLMLQFLLTTFRVSRRLSMLLERNGKDNDESQTYNIKILTKAQRHLGGIQNTILMHLGEMDLNTTKKLRVDFLRTYRHPQQKMSLPNNSQRVYHSKQLPGNPATRIRISIPTQHKGPPPPNSLPQGSSPQPMV
jgi:hypothetical protein